MLKRQTIELLSLALPIMIETILQTLLGTTDTYFAGQLTDAAISGISVTNVVMNIFISFFCGSQHWYDRSRFTKLREERLNANGSLYVSVHFVGNFAGHRSWPFFSFVS